MGGYGSTRWAAHTKADTVEDSLVLDAGPVSRDLFRRASVSTVGTLRWTRGDREVASVSLVACVGDFEDPWVTISYQRDGTPVRVRVALATSRTPSGGLRWWWRCPVLRCGKRVQKLYLSPSSSVFACRTCHRLTYKSSQEHDKGVDAFLRDPAVMRSALSAPAEALPARTLLKALKADILTQERLTKRLRRLER